MATENTDCIEACRTCGVFYLTTSNFLRPMFSAAVDDPEMMLIRLELGNWKVDVNEEDGLPQFICTGCIYEFQKIFKFRHSCVDMQQQLRQFYEMRNLIKIKTEVIETPESNSPFIYVDDLSDNECGGAVTPFNVPHAPIKEEVIEEATVPQESPEVLNNGDTLQNSALPQKPNGQAAVLSFIHCKQCPHVANTAAEYQKHVQCAHNAKTFQCHICGKSFKNCTAARLKLHLKFHKISKHIKCAQCNFYCGTRKALNEHKQTAHIRFRCDHCNKSFSTKRRQEEHLEQTHSDAESPNIAAAQFLTMEGNLINQNQLETRRGEDQEEQFADMETISTVSSKIKEGKDDSESSSNDTEPDNCRPYNCAQCPQTFAQLEDLRFHHKQHLGKPVFKCPVCGKSFDLSFGLKRHLKKHTKAPF